ncbi:MAG TPA: WbqC family protein [Bryobacteraceae bacterium]|nr:WbqC family protein [Bryobacteraceae bacterium]
MASASLDLNTAARSRTQAQSCVILQPSYIPWRGYFHQIQKADLFVFYDDVQYDDRGWRNRNRIKTRAGSKWLTIPVAAKGAQVKSIPIDEVHICWDRDWAKDHLKSFQHNYAHAPYFDIYEPLLKEWFGRRPDRLADFTIETTIELAHELGIENTRFLRSSELECLGSKTDRLLNILMALGAKHYISGPSAKDYLEVEKLAQHGISVEWMSYDYPDYPQLFPPFDPFVSVLDLLMNTGPRASTHIWQQSQR